MSASPVTTGEVAQLLGGRPASPRPASTVIVRSRSVTMPTGRPPSSASTTEPTLRSRISSATWCTGVAGEAVTTSSVMMSRSSTVNRYHVSGWRSGQRRIRPVAPLTPAQERTRERVETRDRR